MIIISRHAMQITVLISPIWILKRSFLKKSLHNLLTNETLVACPYKGCGNNRLILKHIDLRTS